MKIGEAIRKTREQLVYRGENGRRRKYSQRLLASIIGVDHTTMSHWEMGIRKPDALSLITICISLGVSMDELLEGVEDGRGNVYEAETVKRNAELYIEKA
jgi:transcriptional regulator with XRE-family HTH domain